MRKGRKLGREEGLQEGKQEGKIEGRRETLLRPLRHRFGDLPDEVISRIERIESPAELNLLADKMLDAHSLAEMGLMDEV